MIIRIRALARALALLVSAGLPTVVAAQDGGRPEERVSRGEASAPAADCSALPDHGTLASALGDIVKPGNSTANGGLGNHMWAVLVDRSGAVCAVARSGQSYDAQWIGSRAIAAKKAFTANAFSLPNFALSTANLYFPSQPGNSLYALETGNPLVEERVYRGPPGAWGTPSDPLIGWRVGGTTLFGGGLALYDGEGRILGGLGLSGDKSCTDHVVAWKLRSALALDNVPMGVSPQNNDNIIHDIIVDPASGRLTSASGYGHPVCGPRAEEIAEQFSKTYPTGPKR
ncbi:MAG: heme-binding protein [Alphaproteobacteria bacterium]|nr:heme-binding protein [Alphaproteobacteria bacterium]